MGHPHLKMISRSGWWGQPLPKMIFGADLAATVPHAFLRWGQNHFSVNAYGSYLFLPKATLVLVYIHQLFCIAQKKLNLKSTKKWVLYSLCCCKRCRCTLTRFRKSYSNNSPHVTWDIQRAHATILHEFRRGEITFDNWLLIFQAQHHNCRYTFAIIIKVHHRKLIHGKHIISRYMYRLGYWLIRQSNWHI
jgi:hypothetical protein